jgi:hypothetical protein
VKKLQQYALPDLLVQQEQLQRLGIAQQITTVLKESLCQKCLPVLQEVSIRLPLRHQLLIVELAQLEIIVWLALEKSLVLLGFIAWLQLKTRINSLVQEGNTHRQLEELH